MENRLSDKLKEFERLLPLFPEVRYVGDLILHKTASEASLEEGEEIGTRLIEVLRRYRAETGLGRGFAAPQIGESKAVFTTFVEDEFQIFINPKIVEKSEETNFFRELCWSAGIMAAEVERPEWIVLEWMDNEGKSHREKFDGFRARLYQHEEAHLRGKLNLDEAVENGIEFALFDPSKEIIRKSRFDHEKP